MFQRLTIAVIFLGFSLSANADVWRWTDMSGVVRYVTSTKALYTWSDEMGKVHYSDSPDHEDAIRVELVWHANGGRSMVADNAEARNATDMESDIDRLAREEEETRYCQRAKEVYDSYVNAPRLYNTDEKGEREYLKPYETRKLLAETRATVEELCKYRQ